MRAAVPMKWPPWCMASDDPLDLRFGRISRTAKPEPIFRADRQAFCPLDLAAQANGSLALVITLAILTTWQQQSKGGDPMSKELRAVTIGLGMRSGQLGNLALS